MKKAIYNKDLQKLPFFPRGKYGKEFSLFPYITRTYAISSHENMRMGGTGK